MRKPSAANNGGRLQRQNLTEETERQYEENEMQYGYNTRTGQKLQWSQFFDGDPAWQMISHEELWKLNHGVSWQKILEERGAKRDEAVAFAAVSTTNETANEDVSVVFNVPKKRGRKPKPSPFDEVRKAEKERRDAKAKKNGESDISISVVQKRSEVHGEEDVFGREKGDKFFGIDKNNVTLEMLDALKDEELHEFSKRVFHREQYSVEGLDEDEKRRAYRHIRHSLKNNIKAKIKKREERWAIWREKHPGEEPPAR